MGSQVDRKCDNFRQRIINFRSQVEAVSEKLLREITEEVHPHFRRQNYTPASDSRTLHQS